VSYLCNVLLCNTKSQDKHDLTSRIKYKYEIEHWKQSITIVEKLGNSVLQIGEREKVHLKLNENFEQTFNTCKETVASDLRFSDASDCHTSLLVDLSSI